MERRRALMRGEYRQCSRTGHVGHDDVRRHLEGTSNISDGVIGNTEEYEIRRSH
jgi:hypothetical protein